MKNQNKSVNNANMQSRNDSFLFYDNVKAIKYEAFSTNYKYGTYFIFRN